MSIVIKLIHLEFICLVEIIWNFGEKKWKRNLLGFNLSNLILGILLHVFFIFYVRDMSSLIKCTGSNYILIAHLILDSSSEFLQNSVSDKLHTAATNTWFSGNTYKYIQIVEQAAGEQPHGKLPGGLLTMCLKL